MIPGSTAPVCAASVYAAPVPRLRPSTLSEWHEAFDPAVELDWSRADYGRRLLAEHLDQSHDGASRRRATVRRQVRRLRSLLPAPPARLLDAACGPGLYAVPLAEAGFEVTGIDVNQAALRHARRLARASPAAGRLRFRAADLRAPVAGGPFDAALLIYYVLEAFPRREQPAVLRRVAAALKPGGVAIVEMRLRPDQLEGRLPWWQVVPRSVLADRRHLLLGDTTYDRRRNLYVLREIAIFDDGSVAVQQSSAWFCPFDAIPSLFARAGLRVEAIHDGWTRDRGSQLSESVLVTARRH
jgi:SAM-dependent methyltransferase